AGLALAQYVITDGYALAGVDLPFQSLLTAVTLRLLAYEKASQRLSRLPVAQHGCGRHRDRPDLQATDGRDVEVTGGVVEQFAEQADRLAVEEHFLTVDVVTALLTRREREVAEGHGA